MNMCTHLYFMFTGSSFKLCILLGLKNLSCFSVLFTFSHIYKDNNDTEIKVGM